MLLAQLPLSEIRRRLNSDGLTLSVGIFNFSIVSPLKSVAEGICLLYADYESVENCSFFDFRVAVKSNSFADRLLNKVGFYSDNITPFNPFPRQHATALLEWGMNWCVSSHINNYLIVHAAVIEKDGFSVIMPAPPGSGKSTLTAALIQEGWRLLSDELTIIDINTGMVLPFPRPVSLKNQSIEIIKKYYPETIFGPMSVDTVKGSVASLKPPTLSIKQQLLPCPVGWIIFPKFEAGIDADLSEKSRAHSFMDVADNSFNYSLLGIKAFNTLRNIVDSAQCYTFRYSRLEDAIEVFNDLKIFK